MRPQTGQIAILFMSSLSECKTSAYEVRQFFGENLSEPVPLFIRKIGYKYLLEGEDAHLHDDDETLEEVIK